MSDQPLWKRIDDALMVDEIGIEAARCGPYLLKTVYQPIFRNRSGQLVPWGVRGDIVPYRNGRPASCKTFAADMLPRQAAFVEGVSRMLQLRNYRNIGIAGLALLASFDPAAASRATTTSRQASNLADLLEEIELPRELLICEIAENVKIESVRPLAVALRRRGIRVAIGQFGVGTRFLERARLADSDLIRLDSGWFRRIVEVPGASGLLASLLAAIHAEGREVLVDGLETVDQLRVALDAGVDLLQGDLLRPAKLAGAIFDTSPLNRKALLAPRSKILRFTGSRGRKDGRR